MRRLGILALTAFLALNGCSMPKPRDEDKPPPSPSASASASASSTGAACRVSGFTPTERIELTGVRLTLLYGGGVALAPGGSRRGSEGYDLIGTVHPGVRVSSPAGAELDPATARGIASSVAGGSVRSLPDAFAIPFDEVNPTRRNQAYAAYGVAQVYRGRWSATFCGGSVNDGSEAETWRGTFTTVGRVRTGVVRCDALGSKGRELARAVGELCV